MADAQRPTLNAQHSTLNSARLSWALDVERWALGVESFIGFERTDPLSRSIHCDILAHMPTRRHAHTLILRLRYNWCPDLDALLF
jgi:hypothetical protein